MSIMTNRFYSIIERELSSFDTALILHLTKLTDSMDIEREFSRMCGRIRNYHDSNMRMSPKQLCNFVDEELMEFRNTYLMPNEYTSRMADKVLAEARSEITSIRIYLKNLIKESDA